MQSKGAIKLLAVLLALACVYQLSFTFKTRSVEKKASEYAAQFPLDQQGEAEQHYLDSVQNLGVYNLGFKKFTYKECKEKELNLGLDLKGGMNVMLEVQVEDVVKALAGDSQHDPAFVGAIAEANAALKDGTSKDYISDFVKAYQRLSNGGSLAAIFVSPDRKDITLESSDADVEKILKKETDAAIAASFNVLRSRIDHFGVTQPNIMRLPNSHRILVELPGVKEPQRVRDLLQGTASLEFWLTYDAREVLPALAAADKLVKAELAELPAATQPETASAEAEAVGEQTASGDAAGLIAEIGADSVALPGRWTQAATTVRRTRCWPCSTLVMRVGPPSVPPIRPTWLPSTNTWRTLRCASSSRPTSTSSGVSRATIRSTAATTFMPSRFPRPTARLRWTGRS